MDLEQSLTQITICTEWSPEKDAISTQTYTSCTCACTTSAPPFFLTIPHRDLLLVFIEWGWTFEIFLVTVGMVTGIWFDSMIWLI